MQREPPAFIEGRCLFETGHLVEGIRYFSYDISVILSEREMCIVHRFVSVLVCLLQSVNSI